jgi:hypothetical protein
MRDCPEGQGPGQFAEDGEVIYGAPDPVRVRPQVSYAEADRRFARAFPEWAGAADMAAAAALGIKPGEIGATA